MWRDTLKNLRKHRDVEANNIVRDAYSITCYHLETLICKISDQELTHGYCRDCEKDVKTKLYNGKVDPPVFVCEECGQFIYQDLTRGHCGFCNEEVNITKCKVDDSQEAYMCSICRANISIINSRPNSVEPVRYEVDAEKFDEGLGFLLDSVQPKVPFSNDINDMRATATSLRYKLLVKAYNLLSTLVAGQRYV